MEIVSPYWNNETNFVSSHLLLFSNKWPGISLHKIGEYAYTSISISINDGVYVRRLTNGWMGMPWSKNRRKQLRSIGTFDKLFTMLKYYYIQLLRMKCVAENNSVSCVLRSSSIALDSFATKKWISRERKRTFELLWKWDLLYVNFKHFLAFEDATIRYQIWIHSN